MLPTELTCYRLTGLPAVTLTVIAEECIRLWSTSLVDVAFLVLAEEDSTSLLEELARCSGQAEQDGKKLLGGRHIQRLVNHATGGFIEVFSSSELARRSILFGVYHSPLSKLLRLSQPFEGQKETTPSQEQEKGGSQMENIKEGE